MKHNKVIQEEFSKQASKFEEKGLTLSSQDLLEWIVDSLPLEREFRVLDVAAGTGHLSRAIAPHVRDVIAVDITPEMLDQARKETAKRNMNNIIFEEGNAAQLPYEADRFDLVASRLAIHHFEKPIIQLREMTRVCKPNHRIAIIDLLAPENEEIAKTYNNLERLRDPSHTMALSKAQMAKLFADAGIVIERVETRDVEVDFQRWIRMTGTKVESVEVLIGQLMKEVNEDSETGMRPFIINDSLKFLQVWSIFIGIKASSTKRP